MIIDPKVDPRKVDNNVRCCCKCNRVVDYKEPDGYPVKDDYYYYPGEGFYCENCNYVHKKRD